VKDTIATAESPASLIVHWFLTPDDTSVHMDDHFADDSRTLKFMSVVVPTLADQLDASMLAVAVPWELNDAGGLMVLLTALQGAEPTVEARTITRATGSSGPPWWVIGETQVEAPQQMRELAKILRI
jgi:hypothetical protein